MWGGGGGGGVGGGRKRREGLRNLGPRKGHTDIDKEKESK